MRVLLSTPPGKTTERWPPLGLLYIAAKLKTKREDEVKIIDAFCENLSKGELVDRVVREQPDVFGMNCSTHIFLDAMDVLNELQKRLPDTKLVLGGYHATFTADKIIRDYPFIDYVIKGEAENSFPQLLDRIENNQAPNDVAGICYRNGSETIDNPFSLITDLDSLPFPDRSMLGKLDYGYTHDGIQLTVGKFTTICTSRGCPFKCRYCSCASFSLRKWRPRSAENVVDELEEIQSQGYESVTVVDDNFTQNRKRVEKICELLRSRKIKLQYYFEGRVEGASYEMLRNMKRAGFNVIYFGVESASQHVLDYYNKTISPEKSMRAIENAKKAGMLVVTSYIFGSPVEKKEDIMRTIEFIRKMKPHAVQINILDCLVGTPIWDELQENGLLTSDAWKTNHRIYEYAGNGLSKEALEDLVDAGYSAYLGAWKNFRGVVDLSKVIVVNKTARKIVLQNIANPATRRKLSEGIRGVRENRASRNDQKTAVGNIEDSSAGGSSR
ncbi:MAG: B12-binding domain-containing radical SAM protein [Thermoplasmata archaeon]|nr:B12-binding domain-containing radical SAM protein [Thermoplasmata archaeon]